MALVLAFTVTRVIFIPQGEFVAWGALTLAALQAGKLPGTAWLLLVTGVAVTVVEICSAWRQQDWRGLPRVLGWNIAYPLVVLALARFIDFSTMPMVVQILFALLIVVREDWLPLTRPEYAVAGQIVKFATFLPYVAAAATIAPGLMHVAQRWPAWPWAWR